MYISQAARRGRQVSLCSRRPEQTGAVRGGSSPLLSARLYSAVLCCECVRGLEDHPVTPDSETRWRGKWGFGAEEFTVSRETFTSIWAARSTSRTASFSGAGSRRVQNNNQQNQHSTLKCYSCYKRRSVWSINIDLLGLLFLSVCVKFIFAVLGIITTISNYITASRQKTNRFLTRISWIYFLFINFKSPFENSVEIPEVIKGHVASFNSNGGSMIQSYLSTLTKLICIISTHWRGPQKVTNKIRPVWFVERQLFLLGGH